MVECEKVRQVPMKLTMSVASHRIEHVSFCRHRTQSDCVCGAAFVVTTSWALPYSGRISTSRNACDERLEEYTKYQRACFVL